MLTCGVASDVVSMAAPKAVFKKDENELNFMGNLLNWGEEQTEPPSNDVAPLALGDSGT